MLRHAPAAVDAGVDAHAGAAGRVVLGDEAGPRREGARILGVDAALDRVAAEAPRARVGQLELLAGGDADLLRDEVEAGHHLGHRVLDLHARVHLEEVELPLLVHEELERAERRVAGLEDRLADRPRPSAARSSGVIAGLGASSMTFWWRRWSEHSRSPSVHTPPCLSASTWNSMCFGRSTKFSR